MIGCEQKTKDNPPHFAKAIAKLSSETACIIAETKGTFNSNEGLSPFLNLTIGAVSLTLLGIQSNRDKFGISKYSLNVLEASL